MEEIEEGANKRQIGIKWGLILGLVGTIVFTVPAAMRVNFNGMILVYWAYFITILALGMKEYKRENANQMSFGDAFGLGMLISLIGGLSRAVMRFVYVTVDTEYVEFVREASENNPFGPQPDSGQDFSGLMEAITSPLVISLFSFLGAIFAGLIFGAIVSAIVKNDEEEF